MKILISDFDRTFFRDHYLNNIKIVNELVSGGNIFIIATGRNISSLMQKIKDHQINYKYLICNDGGITYDHNLKVINRIDIEPATAKEIFEILTDDPCTIECYTDDSLSLNSNCSGQANAIIASYNDDEQATLLLERIIKLYPSVHGYISDRWINITNHLVDKGQAIDYLVNLNQLNKPDIYVVGDNLNDLSMHERYRGYAMADGVLELQKISHQVINDFSEVVDQIYEDINKRDN